MPRLSPGSRSSAIGAGRAARDAVTLEFLEFGGDVAARGDELAVALTVAQLGQGGRQKQRGKLLGRVLLFLAILGGSVDQFADHLTRFHDAIGGDAAAMRIAQQKTGIGGDARGVGRGIRAQRCRAGTSGTRHEKHRGRHGEQRHRILRSSDPI